MWTILAGNSEWSRMGKIFTPPPPPDIPMPKKLRPTFPAFHNRYPGTQYKPACQQEIPEEPDLENCPVPSAREMPGHLTPDRPVDSSFSWFRVWVGTYSQVIVAPPPPTLRLGKVVSELNTTRKL